MKTPYTDLNSFSWDDLRYLWAIHQTGSLSQAATLLGTTQPTVGRRLTALEEALGVILVERTAQGCVLTQAGRALEPWLEQMSRGAHGIEQATRLAHVQLEGSVRVACGELVALRLMERLGELLERAPRLELSFLTGLDFVNLARGEAEIALRTQIPAGDQWVIRRFGRAPFAIFASARYAQLHPECRDEQWRWAYGRWICIKGAGSATWVEQHAQAGAQRLYFDRSAVALEAVKQGLGMALLPMKLSLTTGLVQLEAKEESFGYDSVMVMSSQAARLERVKLVSRWLAEVLG